MCSGNSSTSESEEEDGEEETVFVGREVMERMRKLSEGTRGSQAGMGMRRYPSNASPRMVRMRSTMVH